MLWFRKLPQLILDRPFNCCLCLLYIYTFALTILATEVILAFLIIDKKGSVFVIAKQQITTPPMYKVLNKDTIANEIIPHLSAALSYFNLIGI